MDIGPIAMEHFESARKRAAGIVAKMTLEEKISQFGNRVPPIPRLNLPAFNYYASEALHVLNAMSGAVDLLVTDVVMPGMTGVELAAAVRWRYPAVDVLFVSGHPDDDGVVHDPLPEHAALLAKPFGPEDLILRVREILDRSPSETAGAPDAPAGAPDAIPGAPDAIRGAQAPTAAQASAT